MKKTKQSVQTKKLMFFTGATLALLAMFALVGIVSGRFNPVSFIFKAKAAEFAQGWINLRVDDFESGNFSAWDQTNASEGTLTIVDGSTVESGNYQGTKLVRATQNGSSSTNGHFARTIWNLPDWNEGYTYRTQFAFYLPADFYSNMMGAVQLVGWDTNPVLQNQMRLVIFNGDRKARLFIKEDGKDRELTGTFSIPDKQWVKLAIEQKLSQTDGWSKVYMNDVLVASGSLSSCPTNAVRCNDTLTAYPVTRLRYGLVAIADVVQAKPLTLYFDDVSLGIPAAVSSTPTPTLTMTPTPTPTPTTTADTTPPVVEITKPVSGTVVTKGSKIDIVATASDNVGVTNVMFLVDGAQVCSDTSVPFSCRWNVPRKPKSDTVVVSAVAKDLAGNSSSTQVTIKIAL